jgi:hypothetical protein
MTGSAKFCPNGFRYERINGPGHWMIEAPDTSARHSSTSTYASDRTAPVLADFAIDIDAPRMS